MVDLVAGRPADKSGLRWRTTPRRPGGRSDTTAAVAYDASTRRRRSRRLCLHHEHRRRAVQPGPHRVARDRCRWRATAVLGSLQLPKLIASLLESGLLLGDRALLISSGERVQVVSSGPPGSYIPLTSARTCTGRSVAPAQPRLLSTEAITGWWSRPSRRAAASGCVEHLGGAHGQPLPVTADQARTISPLPGCRTVRWPVRRHCAEQGAAVGCTEVWAPAVDSGSTSCPPEHRPDNGEPFCHRAPSD